MISISWVSATLDEVTSGSRFLLPQSPLGIQSASIKWVCFLAVFGLANATPALAAHFTTTAQQAVGEDWNAGIWQPGSVSPTAGNTYECLPGGNATRIRSPASGGMQTFPGDSLQLDAGSEIRAKGPAGTVLNFPGVSGNAGLILNGGNLDAGDNAVFQLAGILHVQAPSSFTCGDTNANSDRGWQIAAQIRGAGGLTVMKNASGGVPAVELTRSDNPFSGTWTVVSGLLKATAPNSLGTGDIMISPTNPAVNPAQLEVDYDTQNPGTLVLTNGGRMILHQNCRFGAVIINGHRLGPGWHSAAELATQFPQNFLPGSTGGLTVPGPSLFYEVTDLGSLGLSNTVACDINNLGQVAGYSTVNGTNGRVDHAFLWSNGTMQDLEATDQLGAPDPASMSRAYGVNNNGQVVGESGGRPALWQHGGVQVLSVMVSNQVQRVYGTAFSINNNGQAAGVGRNWGAFIWDGSSVQWLDNLRLGGDPYPLYVSDFYLQTYGINNQGQIVGAIVPPAIAPYSRAFLFENNAVTVLDTNLYIGGYGGAYDINESGQIVGVAKLDEMYMTRAFFYDHGTWTWLGSGSPNDRALGINSQGDVVGAFDTVPFLWHQGDLILLQGRIPSSPSYCLSEPKAINDRGQIVVNCPVRGMALLLTPIPALAIQRDGATIKLSWPKWAVGYRLRQTSGLGAGSSQWSDFGGAPSDQGEHWEVSIPTSQGSLFFQLQKGP